MNDQENKPTGDFAANPEDGNVRRSSRRNRRRRGPKPAQEQLQQAGEQPAALAPPEPIEQERPHTGNAAKPKRRNSPRRAPVPEFDSSTVVVRATAPQIAPLQPMRLLPIDAVDTSEPEFGCPMLTRTRIGIPFRGGQRVARCSVGWAIHDEDEVLFCMHTETAAQCWKSHPDQLELLIEKLQPIIEAELASGQ